MSPLGVLFAVVFGMFAAAVEGEGIALLGLVLGYSFGALLQLQSRVKRLEHQLAQSALLQTAAPGPAPRTSGAAPAAAPPTLPARPSAPDPIANLQLWTTEPRQSHRPAAAVAGAPRAAGLDSPAMERPSETVLFDKLAGYVKSFFTDGNVVVKVGLLVLFIGVGFLIKYAAEHDLLPIELRAAVIGLAGIALLVVGWRLRHDKGIYALLLQGGGVGVMYVNVFGAAKLYQLIPASAALVIMVALVALSGVLAVLQNAKYLAFYGAAGGFLAPILASTGSGSHVMLFSYYALLNLGIVGIAWFRSWRELNLLGFVFTFAIGMLWGAKYYQPAYFASVEPFLIVFFVFFVTIAILFALRQPPQLKGYVDSSLVFGVPIIAFGLQAALVKDTEYGLAFSALGMSAFYVALASALWRRQLEGMRLLTEAFLAMGVVFGTLAIPLAMDGRWTSVAWALEGAAIVWVGVRQQRVLARAFGVLLQAGSGLFFFQDLHLAVSTVPILNGSYIGALLVSLAGLFSSYYLYQHTDQLRPWERPAHLPLLLWGLCWWFGAGLHEIDEHTVGDILAISWTSMFISGSLLLARYLERRLSWPMLRYPIFGQLYAMLALLGLSMVIGIQHPLADFGWLAWPLAIGTLYYMLYYYRDGVRSSVLQWQHIIGFWFLVVFVSWEASWWAGEHIGGNAWRDATYGLVPALIMLALLRRGRALRWPVAAHFDWYAGYAALPVMALLGLFAFATGTWHEGNPWPVTYIPFANPVDIVVGLIMYLTLLWRHQLRQGLIPMGPWPQPRQVGYASAVIGFFWLNGIIARSVHHWFGIPHDLSALTDSVIFQASISVAWTLTSLSVMFVASRRARRESWFVGLGLFAVVVAKLFVVDISQENELVMIMSLIIVAVLAIVFGYYLSPLPPRSKKEPA